ncbi:hypothetical protein BDN71DRAFT_1440959 [Pleurotus eryngii]|uniref:Uncharacterized protein n=1 Tax=Pleurotus eryngii TaxID=5323 RepID=A0A9P6A646_PLEER|nr:hypothetical protein BDN71DRAFT_1440959 [Pleurotus eryngii]
MIKGHVDGQSSLKNFLLVSQSSRSLIEHHLYVDVSFLRHPPLRDDEWDRLDLGHSAQDEDSSLQCPKSVLSVGKSFLLSLTTNGGRRARYFVVASIPSIYSRPYVLDLNWINYLDLRHFFDGSRPSFSLRSFAWLTGNVQWYVDGLGWLLSGQTSLEYLSLFPSSTRSTLSPVAGLDLASLPKASCDSRPVLSQTFQNHNQARSTLTPIHKLRTPTIREVAAPNLEYLEVDTFCVIAYSTFYREVNARTNRRLSHSRQSCER